jgi:hypothetical protein
MIEGSPGDKYKVILRIAGRWRTVDWEYIESGSAPDDNGQYYLAASWSAWSCDQELDKRGAGEYVAEVLLTSSLGRFQIVRNQDWSQTFFPGETGVLGPSIASYAESWHIDGQVGDVYEIKFKRQWKSAAFETEVSWKKIGTRSTSDLADSPWPRYYLAGAGSSIKHEMEPFTNTSYGITLQLTTGPVPFQILFDGDFRRVFYPSVSCATAKSKHAILGPSPNPDSRLYWKIERDLDDTAEEGGWYTVELTVSAIDKSPTSVWWTRIA